MIFWDQSEKHTLKKYPVYSSCYKSKCFCAPILARRLLQQIESETPVPWYEETRRGLGALSTSQGICTQKLSTLIS